VCILDFGLKETTCTEDNYQSNMKEFIDDTIDKFYDHDRMNMFIDELMEKMEPKIE
jgi:hypothetical protein